jgi:4-hydroxy-3-polyprenylbenzoate decarboxylase
MSAAKRLIVGISGAPGVIYGVRMLQALNRAGVESHLVVSRAARRTLQEETDYTIEEVRALASVSHPIEDIGASTASGSFKTEGMVIAPCSTRTAGEIASCVTSSLLTRAADVCSRSGGGW